MKNKLKLFIESMPEMAKPTSEFRASYAGTCLRKMDYDGIHGATPHDELAYFRFELGHGVDKIFKSLLSQCFGADFMGMDDELRLTTPNGNTIVGHPDGRLLSQNAVVEIKSCAASTFDLVEKTGQPLQEHFEQANLYAHALKADKIIFIYFNKNSSKYSITEKQYDLGQAIYNLEKFDLAADNRAKGVLSPRLYQDETASPCYYCGHREKCYADFVKNAQDMKVQAIADPVVGSLATLFHDSRQLRLDTEKLQDKYGDSLALTLANDHKTKEALVEHEGRKFTVTIKPPPKNKKFSVAVKEINDEQSTDDKE